MRKALFAGLAVAGMVLAFQRPFREMPGIEYSLGSIPVPADHAARTEWAFARLMFPPGPLNGYAGRDDDWPKGWRDVDPLHGADDHHDAGRSDPERDH